MEEALFIVVDEFTGLEIESDWHPVGHFKPGDRFMDSFHMGIVAHVKEEGPETFRVFIKEEF